MNQGLKIRLNRIKEQLEVIDKEICDRNDCNNSKSIEIQFATDIETVIANIQFVIHPLSCECSICEV